MAPGVSDISRRRSAVWASLEGAVDGLLVTAPANVRYLSGFTGTNGWLLLGSEQALFLTDPRYAEQAAEQLGDIPVVVSSTGLHDALAQAVQGRDLGRLGFEPERVASWLSGAGFDGVRIVPLRPDPDASGPLLFLASATV